jgi:hypothetical protein
MLPLPLDVQLIITLITSSHSRLRQRKRPRLHLVALAFINYTLSTMSIFCLVYLLAMLTLIKAGDDIGTLGYGPGPIEDTNAFQRANMFPNATGAVDIRSVNMRSSDPQSILWKAHLNVTEVTNLNYTKSATDVITNSVIAIDATGEWIEDSEWSTEAIIFLLKDRKTLVDGQKDTGNCYATLGETCVKDYLNSVIISRPRNNTATNKTAITIPILASIPNSCEDKLPDEFDTRMSPSNHSNRANVKTAFTSNFANGSAYFYCPSTPHSSSNTTSYEEAVTRIWPISLRQTHNNGTSVVSLSCLKANVTTSGSKAIGGVPSAAAAVQRCGWAVVGFVWLTAVLVL